jgi:hypothetical protein
MGWKIYCRMKKEWLGVAKASLGIGRWSSEALLALGRWQSIGCPLIADG